ncbi:MAG: hypothetical protein ACU836_18025 [Gammaproteobacteria bacterium]
MANQATATCAKKNDVSTRKAKQSNHDKAAFGERVAHDKLVQNGFEPIGNTDGVYHPGKQGIDGVYKHPDPSPDYVCFCLIPRFHKIPADSYTT